MLWYAGVLALSLVAFALVIYYAAAKGFHDRQDESLRSTAQTVASAYVEEIGEAHSLTKAAEIVLVELTFPNRYVQIIDSNGHSIASSKNLSGTHLTIPPGTVGFVTVDDTRVAVVPVSSDPTLGFAAVAEPLSVLEEGLGQLRRDFFAGVPLVLVLASLGGYILARKSLEPIASMVNEQQRFIADASHELRTPLAVLRGETEVALGRTRTVEEYQESLTLIQEEAERLSRIVEDLFILARQPIQSPTALVKEPVSLTDVVKDCARAAQVLASRKGVRLKLENDSTSIALNADEELIKRMILNLLDNAVKYTPEGGEISLALEKHNGSAEIVVRDTGIGLSQTDQQRVFDRFYRVDKARSRALGGAGLGLSIARSIVEAHGGNITIDSTPRHGSTFTVSLPLATKGT
ncbi:MAG TPA: HAMP domain-containing sensor histidine kinase [Pyrinomonadaceae bacterium]|nr:HAMP domain-containing sensor histidine kinase [Pyrinomonadaceae bacterium]